MENFVRKTRDKTPVMMNTKKSLYLYRVTLDDPIEDYRMPPYYTEGARSSSKFFLNALHTPQAPRGDVFMN
jgi:hypothetical protein